MKEYEIQFPGGWCYIKADKIVTNSKTGQRVFYDGEKIVGVIRLNSKGLLITGFNVDELTLNSEFNPAI